MSKMFCMWSQYLSQDKFKDEEKRHIIRFTLRHINLRVHYLESHLTSEKSEVLLTQQKEGQHLILCPTSSSISFCAHPIQPRLDKAKLFTMPGKSICLWEYDAFPRNASLWKRQQVTATTTSSSKLDALEMGQKVEIWPRTSHRNHWEECFYISYVIWELHSLKIPWGCKEERGTDSKMAPQCPPASHSETDGVWQAISWQKPSPNLSIAVLFQGNLKHIFSPSSKRQ